MAICASVARSEMVEAVEAAAVPDWLTHSAIRRISAGGSFAVPVGAAVGEALAVGVAEGEVLTEAVAEGEGEVEVEL